MSSEAESAVGVVRKWNSPVLKVERDAPYLRQLTVPYSTCECSPAVSLNWHPPPPQTLPSPHGRLTLLLTTDNTHRRIPLRHHAPTHGHGLLLRISNKAQ